MRLDEQIKGRVMQVLKDHPEARGIEVIGNIYEKGD